MIIVPKRWKMDEYSFNFRLKNGFSKMKNNSKPVFQFYSSGFVFYLSHVPHSVIEMDPMTHWFKFQINIGAFPSIFSVRPIVLRAGLYYTDPYMKCSWSTHTWAKPATLMKMAAIEHASIRWGKRNCILTPNPINLKWQCLFCKYWQILFHFSATFRYWTYFHWCWRPSLDERFFSQINP